jgi:2-polyprenyl-3-methyl-5-hydroxy-6-metoxy-1,4-benzoquinol methylase
VAGCCDPRRYEDVFGERFARKVARHYRRKGLGRTERRMLAFLEGQGLQGATVLEIGGGLGELQVEMLRRGAAHATNLELAGTYEAEARRLLDEQGLTDRVTRRLGVDIARDGDEVEPADIVVLHRVVCCYPDYERLLAAAAEHARRLLVFSYPSHSVLARMVLGAENLSFRMRRLRFRVFAHPPDRMLSVLREHGLRPTVVHRGMAWQVAGAER